MTASQAMHKQLLQTSARPFIRSRCQATFLLHSNGGDGWCGGWQRIGISTRQRACCCGQPSLAIGVGCLLARVDMLQAKRQCVLLCSCLPYKERSLTGDDAGSGLLSCPICLTFMGLQASCNDRMMWVCRCTASCRPRLLVGRRGVPFCGCWAAGPACRAWLLWRCTRRRVEDAGGRLLMLCEFKLYSGIGM